MTIKLAEPLETKRLYIRQFTPEDYEVLVSKLNNVSPEEDYQLFNYFRDRGVSSLLLQLQEPSQIIGYIFLRALEKEKEIDCYYALFPRFLRNGYTIEALRKVFEYIYAHYDFLKITAYIEQGNIRGWKAAERSGMKYMGDVIHGDQNSKVMYYLITKRDYENQLQF